MRSGYVFRFDAHRELAGHLNRIQHGLGSSVELYSPLIDLLSDFSPEHQVDLLNKAMPEKTHEAIEEFYQSCVAIEKFIVGLGDEVKLRTDQTIFAAAQFRCGQAQQETLDEWKKNSHFLSRVECLLNFCKVLAGYVEELKDEQECRSERLSSRVSCTHQSKIDALNLRYAALTVSTFTGQPRVLDQFLSDASELRADLKKTYAGLHEKWTVLDAMIVHIGKIQQEDMERDVLKVDALESKIDRNLASIARMQSAEQKLPALEALLAEANGLESALKKQGSHLDSPKIKVLNDAKIRIQAVLTEVRAWSVQAVVRHIEPASPKSPVPASPKKIVTRFLSDLKPVNPGCWAVICNLFSRLLSCFKTSPATATTMRDVSQTNLARRELGVGFIR